LLTCLSFFLSVAAGLFLAFGPVYQGVTTYSGSSVDLSGGSTTREGLSLIEVNGLWVAWLLAVPFALSGIGLALAYTGKTRSGYGKAYLWIASVSLLAACVAGLMTIGMFYLPTAFLMLAAAITQSRKSSKREDSPAE